jgi:multidrug resistance efflux pump
MLPPIKIKSRRRLWRVWPGVTLAVIAAVIFAFWGADWVWVRGNGIVAGELTSVSPIVQARLKTRFVKCLDHVKRGQRVAEFVNEETVESAAQQLAALQLLLTQARAGIEIANRLAQAAAKLVESQTALLNVQTAVLKAEDGLVKNKYVAVLAWEQAKASVAQADANTKAAEFVYQAKRADEQKAKLDAEDLQKRIDIFVHSPELNGHFYLTAPKDGIVTECTATPGQSVAAGTPIFSIYNPDDTFAVVFFDPNYISRIASGQLFEIRVQGIDEPVTGRVTDFYPELSALPTSLTRYFWQKEIWSQFVPVQLEFADLNATQRSKLFAWAQLSVSRRRSWSAPDATAAAPVSWQWVQQRLGWAWQFVAASSAQQRMDR